MSKRHPLVAAALAVTLLVLPLGAAPTSAAAQTGGDAAPGEADATLSTPIQLVRWTGQLRQNAPSAPVPLPCLENLCHDFRLAVGLPAGTWSQAGGVQVGIRASRGATALYVFDADDQLVASSGDDDIVYNTLFGRDNSVILPEASNGQYRVVIVSPPLNAEQDADPVTYDGYAEVEYFPDEQPIRDRLPNLVVVPTTTARVPTGTGASYGFVEEEFELGGCFLEEMLEAGARKCLRFDTTVANIGDGPFEARFEHGSDFRIMQRVYRSNGESYERQAGHWEPHVTHLHFHYRDYAHNRLWKSSRNGEKLGNTPIRSQSKAPHQQKNLERDDSKNGVCTLDTDNIWFGRKGDAARTYTNSPGACAGSEPLGISVGWADTYRYDFPDQYIEISGIKDGYYLLESEVNPDGTAAESDTSDNSTFVLIRICGNDAELVGKESRCSS